MSEPGRHVLVVAAEPDLALLYRLTLEPEGFEVTDATTVGQGLERIRHQRPDVIVLGTSPSRDGVELVRSITREAARCRVPVVLLTSPQPDESQIQTLVDGITEHLTAPVAPSTLAQVLQDVLATDPADEERRRESTLAKVELLRNS
jgi:CheY-like chemotaxis protein